MIAAPPIAEYDEVRQTIESSFEPETLGDPAATSAAFFWIVDAKEPPLRLLLGDWLLPMITESYNERLDAWTTWAEVSNESQGKRPLVGSASTADLP